MSCSGVGKLAVPPLCPSFVSEQGEQEVALAKMLKRWGQKLLKMQCSWSEMWLSGMSSLAHRKRWDKAWARGNILGKLNTLKKNSFFFFSLPDVSIFTAYPGISVWIMRHWCWPYFWWLPLINRVGFDLLQTCCFFAAFSLCPSNLSLFSALNFPAVYLLGSFYAEGKVPCGQRCLFVCYNLSSVWESWSYIKQQYY